MNDSQTGRHEEKLMALEKSADRLTREIFGNGSAGLKDEVRSLRQAVKVATWVAGLIGALMVTDVARRVISVGPDDVYAEVNKQSERLSRQLGVLLHRLDTDR